MPISDCRVSIGRRKTEDGRWSAGVPACSGRRPAGHIWECGARDAHRGRRDACAPAAIRLLSPVLKIRVRDPLPLHVRRRIRAAAFQWHDMIDHVAGPAVRITGHQHKFPPLCRAALRARMRRVAPVSRHPRAARSPVAFDVMRPRRLTGVRERRSEKQTADDAEFRREFARQKRHGRKVQAWHTMEPGTSRHSREAVSISTLAPSEYEARQASPFGNERATISPTFFTRFGKANSPRGEKN